MNCFGEYRSRNNTNDSSGKYRACRSQKKKKNSCVAPPPVKALIQVEEPKLTIAILVKVYIIFFKKKIEMNSEKIYKYLYLSSL